MREPTPLFTLLGIACYPYGAALALGLLLAALMAMASFRKAFGAAEDGLRFSLWALPLGFVGARLGYCAVKASFIAVDFGPAFLYHFGLGGYSMAGAFVGVLAASALFGRITRRGWLPTMGAAMPALLLAGVPAEKIVCLRQELDTADYVDTTGIDKIYILHDVNAISRGRKIRDLVKSRIRAERGAGCEN